MKRIGLTQRVEVVPGYGERRDCLDQRWARLMLSLGYCPVPLANDVADVPLYIAALAIDGVTLTGGNDIGEEEGAENTAPERDSFEHRLLDVCDAGRLPVLGVCRGLQMLNVHHGGGIEPIEGHAAHRHNMGLDTDFFKGCPASIQVNSFHGFAISEANRSSRLKPVAWSEDGTIEAAVHVSLPQFGVMWHPEREDGLAGHDLLMIRAAFGDGQP